MMRIRKLNLSTDGLRRLEQELDRIADKHGIEEPDRFMPLPEFPFDPDLFDDEDDDDY